MPVYRVTSVHNAVVKRMRALKMKKERQRTGLFLAEGIKTVEEALHSNVCIEMVLAEENLPQQFPWLQSYAEQGDLYLATAGIVDSVSDTKSPQGVVAAVRRQEQSIRDIPDILEGTLLVLDEVQDPGNMGTLIRTADAAGCSAVILSEGCVEGYHPKAVRASMGSCFHLPVIQVKDFLATLIALQKEGYFIFAGDLQGNDFYERPRILGKKAILVGNEAHGIRPEVLREVQARFRLPIHGKAESLNAAMAAGIMLYDLIREERESQS